MPKEFASPLETAFGRVLVKRYEPNLFLPLHDHSYGVVALVLSGNFAEGVDGSLDERRAGWLRVLPPEERHSNRYSSAGATCALIEIPSECVSVHPAAARAFARARHLAPFDRASNLILSICRHVCQGPPDDVTLLEVEDLYTQFLASVTATDEAIDRAPPAWLRRAKEQLMDNVRARLSIAALASEAGVSASYLSRAFRAFYGCSPAAFASRARMHWAKRRLLSSDDSISAIAVEAGFYDHSHFTFRFRAATGRTPAAFRREYGLGRELSLESHSCLSDDDS